MTYDLEAIRAAVSAAMPGRWDNPYKGGIVADQKIAFDLSEHDAIAIFTLMNAARNGLLDDAAIGRAVRAAAERDGPEREAMANGLADLEEQCIYVPVNTLHLLHALAATQAIIDFVEEKAGE